MKQTLKTIIAIGLFAASFNTIAQSLNHEQLSVQAVNHNLAVEMVTTKPSFKPNEAIKFNIKGNQDFFLYVFAVDEANGNVTMMLPNKLQKGNKYTANQAHRVPNATEMELISDRPGTEKIVMLASTKYLAWDTKGYVEAGRYMNTQQERFDSQLEALSIRPTANNQRVSSNKQILLREMMVQIDGDQPTQNGGLIIQLSDQQVQTIKPQTQQNQQTQTITLSTQTTQAQDQKTQDQKVQAMGDKSIVFVAMDKDKYAAGDHAYMVYGADRAGYVHLILLDSKKRYTKLTSHAVDGTQIYRLKAQTAKPKGKHKLFAAWSKGEKLDINSIPELRKSKGESLEAFRLVDDSSASYNVFNFKVK